MSDLLYSTFNFERIVSRVNELFSKSNKENDSLVAVVPDKKDEFDTDIFIEIEIQKIRYDHLETVRVKLLNLAKHGTAYCWLDRDFLNPSLSKVFKFENEAHYFLAEMLEEKRKNIKEEQEI